MSLTLEVVPLVNGAENEDATVNVKRDNTENEKSTTNVKKKRRVEEPKAITMLAEVFLRIMYPLSTCMSKFVTTGLAKSLDYSPHVIFHHGSKAVYFSESAWDSFVKHLHLIECYFANNIAGRKTNVRLLDSDIEIDIVKQRGELQMRIRNLTKYDEKLLLTKQEFLILNNTAQSITRYVKQLGFSKPILQDYLIHTVETQPDVPILYSPIDTSIFNRIPYEVEVWRNLRDLTNHNDNQEQLLAEEEEEGENEE